MPRTRKPLPAKAVGMKTRSGKVAAASVARGGARGPTTRARASIQTKLALQPATTTGRKAPTCKHCGKPRAGHGKKCLDGYSKAQELEQMLDKADALAQGVAEAEADLLRQRVDKEVAKIVDTIDASMSIKDVVMTIAPQIADASGGVLSMEALFEALPVLGDDEDEDARSDTMKIDTGKPTEHTSPAKSAMAIDDTANVAASQEDAEEAAVTDAGATSAAAEKVLLNGWKSTPAGDTPMELERNGAKKAPFPSQIERSKRIPRLFQAMAQKGDVLANRADGWTFCMFVPKNGRGEMRTWHSEQVEAEVPALPGAIRELVFEKLEPLRRQRLAESAKVDKARRKELKRWQKEAASAKSEVESLRAQLDEAMKSLRVEKAVQNASKV